MSRYGRYVRLAASVTLVTFALLLAPYVIDQLVVTPWGTPTIGGMFGFAALLGGMAALGMAILREMP